jgi:hypothetical protein
MSTVQTAINEWSDTLHRKGWDIETLGFTALAASIFLAGICDCFRLILEG